MTDVGFSTFILWGVPTAPRLRMFIEEIAPAVRERVAEVRAEPRHGPVNDGNPRPKSRTEM